MRTGRGGLRAPAPSPPGGVKWFPAAAPARYVRLRGPGAARSAPLPTPGLPTGWEHLDTGAGELGPPLASSRGVRSGRRGVIGHFTPRGAAGSIAPSRRPLAPSPARSWEPRSLPSLPRLELAAPAFSRQGHARLRPRLGRARPHACRGALSTCVARQATGKAGRDSAAVVA